MVRHILQVTLKTPSDSKKVEIIGVKDLFLLLISKKEGVNQKKSLWSTAENHTTMVTITGGNHQKSHVDPD